MFRAFWKYRQAEPHKTVRSHLQQHTCKDHRTRCGRFDVSIGQPGVEGEHWHLDRKTDEERQEDPPLKVEWQILANCMEREYVECIPGSKLRRDLRMLRCYRRIREVQCQNAEQHQHGSDQRIKEKLDRRVKLS